MNVKKLAMILTAALAGTIGVVSAAEPGSAAMVVYNRNLPESRAVAEHYAKRRAVPDKQVLGLDLPATETISRADFTRMLQKPLFDYLVVRKIFQTGPWETAPSGGPQRQRVVGSSIRYAVLCYGVPLRILNDDTLVEEGADKVRPELRKNGAAVDNELALLPQFRQPGLLAGLIPNPFYGAKGAQLRQMHPTNGLLIVARLDGPSAAIARGLVDKALEAEERGLWGRAYFDSRGLTNGSYVQGDDWIRGAAQSARRMGFETVLDVKPETFPDSFPMSQIAIYAGWYAGGVCGPLARPQVEFMPGAFAYHIHSFSAATVRSATMHWVGPLLAKGATVSLGSVDEPYLGATSDVPTLLHNLLNEGASFGEAAYSGEHALSWQTTVVGDPLYRPCAVPLDLRHYRLELAISRLVEWSHLVVANRNLVAGAPLDEIMGYLKNVPFTQYSAVLTEKLADLCQQKHDLPNAITNCQNALQRFPSPQQKVRLLLTLAERQTNAGRDQDAAATWQQFFKECPDYPAPVDLYQKLLPLAQKLNNKPLITKCEAEILRLTPPPSTNAPSTNAPPAANPPPAK